jgi:flagellar L-ring protein precursor FlgH
MKFYITILSSLFVVASTATAQTVPATTAAPSNMQTIAPSSTPAEQIRAARGSLMRASMASASPQVSQVSLFAVTPAEPRVIKKHDLVTIIIREESNYSSEGAADLKKESSLNAAINEFVKIDLANLTVKGGGISPPVPTIDISASREAKNDGTVDRRDIFNARVTAEVLDVKPNGTIVLQARKKIRTDDEEQLIVVSGICRAEDVTADNTILSNQLHDQELTKITKGAVRDSTKRGWLTKLLDAGNPF